MVFRVAVSADTTRIDWTLDGQKKASGQKEFPLVFSEQDLGAHTLTVSVDSKGLLPDSRTWAIDVVSVPPGGPVRFKLAVDSDAHTAHGINYPITYMFNLPSAVAGTSVHVKYREGDAFGKLTEKTADAYFNGIEAVRFDYAAHTAYVSVAFSSESDDIFLEFRAADNSVISDVLYVGTSAYYDNRKAVVTATFDDWQNGSSADFIAACNRFQSRRLWASVGIITGDINETVLNEVQGEIDEGFIEPASHSRNHLGDTLFCLNAVSEVVGSSQDIRNNLRLPLFNANGGEEYVHAYLLPFGLICPTTISSLTNARYLVCRNSASEIYGFSSWRGNDEFYGPSGYSIRMGTDAVEDLDLLNGAFDRALASGGIYHLNMHPWALGDTEWSTYGDAHLDYIRGRTDIWYVAFGHLYLYHYVTDRDLVTVTYVEP